ncbi:hypothetical protein VMCG_06816 [Cytospora schulzeri]|uniref:Uncharacterized protein n=1 Tax=Cytospora schulzeri TaxID=448051 RepID=A0A423W695_9PEZI|nr:hypothetical protein VMCG_06816 [Valsa malicola]
MISAEAKQAKSLQNKMEGQPLLELEKLGALDAEMADEIRNIVAEGIAEKFEERYRIFPGERKGVQIRRNRVPAPCTLKRCFDAHVKAIVEDTLPQSIVMARTYGNIQPPVEPQETSTGQVTEAPSRAVAEEQTAPGGSWYRKPDAAPERKARSGRKSSSKPSVTRKTALVDHKTYSSSSRTSSPGKLHKHWENGLTSSTDEAWNKVYGNPYAILNNLPSSGGPNKALESPTTANQSLPSPGRPTKQYTTQSVQDLTSKGNVAPLESDVVDILLNDKLAQDEDGGMATKTEEHGTDDMQPTIEFGDDLIWLSD